MPIVSALGRIKKLDPVFRERPRAHLVTEELLKGKAKKLPQENSLNFIFLDQYLQGKLFFWEISPSENIHRRKKRKGPGLRRPKRISSKKPLAYSDLRYI